MFLVMLGIPALTMMKKTGEIITTKGRIAASMDPLGNVGCCIVLKTQRLTGRC